MKIVLLLNEAEPQLKELQTNDSEESFDKVTKILTMLSFSLNEQADVYSDGLAVLEKESDSLHKKNGRLYEKFDKNKMELDKTRGELEGYIARLSQLELDIEQAKMERAREEANIGAMHKKSREATESWNPAKQLALDSVGKNLSRIVEQLGKAMRNLNTLRREKTSKEQELKNLLDKSVSIEREISKSKTSLERCRTDINRTRLNIVKLSDASLKFKTMATQLKYSSMDISNILDELIELKQHL